MVYYAQSNRPERDGPYVFDKAMAITAIRARRDRLAFNDVALKPTFQVYVSIRFCTPFILGDRPARECI